VEQFGQCCQTLVEVHNLDQTYQAERTLLAGGEHFLALPLNQEPGGLQIAVMSTHLNMDIDCMALALGSTALVLVEAMEVVDVEDNACRLT
jgi:hypothetical protein